MYNFSVKTQSIWFLCYFSAILVLVLALLGELNFLAIKSFSLTQWLLYSGLLFAIGAGFGLGSLDSNERALIWKWKLLWIVFILLGLGLTIDSILGYNSALSGISFNSRLIDWQTVFILSIPFLIYGLVLFFSGMSQSAREWTGKLSIFFFLLFVIGFIVGLAGFGLFFASNGGLKDVFSVPWYIFIDFGAVLGILGIIPLAYVLGANDSQKEKFHKFWLLWAVLSVAGVILYILTAIEILGNIDVIGGASHREGGLILSLVFQAPGFVFLIASTDKEDLIKKLSPVWVILLIVGIVVAFLSQFLNKTFPISTLGLGIGLVIMVSGLIYKSISIDFNPTASSTITRTVSAPVATGTSSKAGFEIPNQLRPEEKRYYIEMQRKTNENWITLLNNAAKQNRLSKDFVNQKVQELNATNAQTESIVASIMEQAKRSSRQSIFEQAMGNEPSASQPQQQPQRGMSSPPPPQATMSSQAPPMIPPGPPMSPPQKPISSGPPMPPPSGGMPPMPPSPPKAPVAPPAAPPSMSGPPKPPSGGMPPMPPSGSSMPPAPSFNAPPSAAKPPGPPGLPPLPPGSPPPTPQTSQQPKPPGAPGGDAVGTARSTSIAELRGEMLKELRRLRDIFNDEQK